MTRLRTALRLLPLAALFALGVPSVALAGHSDSVVTTKKKGRKVVKKKVVRKTVVKKKVVRKKRRRPRKRGPRISEKMLTKGTTGLIIGAGFASQKDDHRTGATEQSYNTETGFIVGARYDKIMNRFLGYRMAVQYHAKGASATSNSVKTDVKLGYLEVPAALFVRFPVNRMITPYVYFGPYAAILLQKEVKVDGTKQKKLADGYSTLDYGLVFGAGAYFALAPGMMASAELGYHSGFADIIDHGETGTNEDDATTNTSVAFTATLHF